MNKPIPLLRFAGSLPGAALLFGAYAYVIVGCLQGRVSWLFGVIALGLAFRTLRAVAQMKRYKAWAKDWQAVNAEVDGLPAATRARSRRLSVIAAALLALVIPALLPSAKQSSDGLATALLGLWAAAGLFLVWKLLAMVGRAGKRSAGALKERKASKAEVEDAAPVSWLLPRASSSPSRAQVQKDLPAHALQLIGSGKQEPSTLKAGSRRMPVPGH